MTTQKSRTSATVRKLALRLCVTATAAFFSTTCTREARADNAPDVVLLKDGGMVRGVIVEINAGKYVDVIAVDGTKRHFDAAGVAYAGAAAGAPKPGESHASPADADSPKATVEFIAPDDPSLEFHLRIGTETATATSGRFTATAEQNNYKDLCTAPCKHEIPAGTYTIGLSKPGGRTFDGAATIPAGRSKVEATLVDHTGRNFALVTTSLALLGGGIAVAVVGAVQTGPQSCDTTGSAYGLAPICSSPPNPNIPLIIGGGAAVLLSVVPILFMKAAEPRFTVVPMFEPTKAAFGSSKREAEFVPKGLELRLTF